MTRLRPRAFGPVLLAAAAAMVLPAGVATANPDRTPTPVPRLSGGFGRPRATPVPAATDTGPEATTDLVHAAQQSREQSQSPEREKSGLTINNRTLVTNPEKGRITTGKSAPAKEAPVKPAAAAVTSAPATGHPPTATPEAPPQGTEAQWQETAHQARKRVEDDRARVAELTAASKKLENDFYAWDDGQYRDRVIKPSWDKTREQLEDAKRELAEAEKELADLPEKARTAGAMPGWIRE